MRQSVKRRGLSPIRTARSRLINLNPGTNYFRAVVDERKNVGGKADGCDGVHGFRREAGGYRELLYLKRPQQLTRARFQCSRSCGNIWGGIFLNVHELGDLVSCFLSTRGSEVVWRQAARSTTSNFVL